MSTNPSNPINDAHATQAQQPFDADPNQQFSVVAGGALYRLLTQSHLLRPPLDFLKRRIALALLLTWVPVAFLALVQPTPSGDFVPFFEDFEVNVRFLISLPILFAADLVVHARLGRGARQFLERGLIPADHTADFYDAARRAIRLRDAILSEVVLLVIVLLVGPWSWRENVEMTRDTWYAFTQDGHLNFTLAGYWYTYISFPIYQFIILRWYFRLFLWFQFLWRIKRLPLRLMPAHPDQTAGLSFVGHAAMGFAPVLFAQGALFSGIIANHIFHEGRTLPEFTVNIVAAVLIVLLCNLGPLLMFLPLLTDAKRRGRFEYGHLASSYVRAFEDKWIVGQSPGSEPLLGTPDIQSLADMANSYKVVDSIRPFPFATDVMVKLAIVTVAPILPLILTVVSLKELLEFLAKTVL